MDKKTSLLLIGLLVVISFALFFYPSEKLNETQISQQTENITKAIPEKYNNPSYCDEDVTCVVGTTTKDLLIDNVVETCVNTYNAPGNTSDVGCACVENTATCIVEPTIHVNINNSNDGKTFLLKTMVTTPKSIEGVVSYYQSTKQLSVLSLDKDGFWGLVLDVEDNTTCSSMNGPRVDMFFLNIERTGKYKIVIPYFIDSECKIKRTVEKEFDIFE